MDHPENAISQLELGLSYARGDIYGRAIEHLTIAIEQGLDEDDEREARSWRSICLGQSGLVEEALADADWLIEWGFYKKYEWRGHLRDRLHDYQGAIADYTRAMELEPERAGVNQYFVRGHVYFRAGMYPEAIDDYTTAISLYDFPSVQAAAYGWRGKAYVELGDYQAGLDDFQRAAELAGSPEPHLTGYYFHRGLAREKLGDLEGAIADYRCEEIDPNHPEASRIMKLLEQFE